MDRTFFLVPQLLNPEMANRTVNFARDKKPDDDEDDRSIAPLVKAATYADKMDEKMARPKRRRGAVLLTGGRMEAVRAALTEVHQGALMQMCTSHGDSPLHRAVRKHDVQLVSLISQQCHRAALDCEVRASAGGLVGPARTSGGRERVRERVVRCMCACAYLRVCVWRCGCRTEWVKLH